jgi:molecular chaperone GrpE (heat shock protein)
MDGDPTKLPATEQGAQTQAAAQQETVDLLPELRQGQTRMEQAIQDLSGQGAFLRLQVGQVLDTMRQLCGIVGNQCTLAAQDQETLREEFRKLQTGGPQRAMAGVYARLFRDLLKVINQLDELVRLGESGARQESEKPWIDAMRITRDGLEATLVEWGCTPIPVKPDDEFDPEIHEAVLGDAGMQGDSASGRIARVVRRGWGLAGVILQHPQVIVR